MKIKKILILAWDFPPYTAIGAARPYSWYNNFYSNNILPILITRHWDDDNNFKNSYIKSSPVQHKTTENNRQGVLIRTPYTSTFRDRLILKYGYDRFSILRKILSFFSMILSFPFLYFDNKKSLFYAAKSYLENEKVDLILATGEPFILHKYAYKLSINFNVPYALDYRDGWTTRDDNLELKGFRAFLNNYYFRFFEKKFLSKSDMVFTSNPFEQKKLLKINHNINLKNVFNGYVEKEINYGKNVSQLSDYFRIGYAGTIYPFNCVEEFLEGMKLFVLKYPQPRIKLLLLGINSQPTQINRILNYSKELIPYIESTDRMDKRDLVKWFCKCNCLLVFTSPHLKLLPSKIYEYLPLKRKILVSLNDNADIKTIMETTNAGHNCNSSIEIFESLEKMYLEFLKFGFVKSNTENFEQYSRKNQAANMSKLIIDHLDDK